MRPFRKQGQSHKKEEHSVTPRQLKHELLLFKAECSSQLTDLYVCENRKTGTLIMVHTHTHTLCYPLVVLGGIKINEINERNT